MVEQLATAPFWAAHAAKTALTEYGPGGETRTFKYADLQVEIDKAAATLAVAGVRPGEHIALSGNNCLEHIFCLLGALQLGAVTCLINTKLAEADQKALIEEADCKFLVSDQNLDINLPSLTLWDIGGAGSTRAEPWHPESDSLAMIMYTSGSSGLPKGVPITHAGYTWALRRFTGLAETMAGKTGIVAAPLFHMNGQFHVLNLLSCGAHVVLMKEFSADMMLQAIDQHDVARVTGVPTMAALMAETVEGSASVNTTGVEQIGLGSSPLSKQLLARIQAAYKRLIAQEISRHSA